MGTSNNPNVLTLITRLTSACEDAGISPPVVVVPNGKARLNVINDLMTAPNSDLSVQQLRKDDSNRIAAAVRLADVPIVVGYRKSGKDLFFLYGREAFFAYCRADKQDMIIPCRYDGDDDAIRLAAASQLVVQHPNSFATLAALVSSFGEDWVGQFASALDLNKADINRAAEIWSEGSGLHTLLNDNPNALGAAHFLLSSNKAADVLTSLRSGSCTPQQAIHQVQAIMAKDDAERAAARAKTVGIHVSGDHQAANYLADLVAKEHNSNQAAAKKLTMMQEACKFIFMNPPEDVEPDLIDALWDATNATIPIA